MGKSFNVIADTLKSVAKNNIAANSQIVKEIELDKIVENELNKFSMDDNTEEFKALINSIKRTGVLQPIVLKKNDDTDTYTVIAGHRRIMASRIIGKKTIPALVKNYANKSAVLDLIETNTTSRKLSIDDILGCIELLENLVKEEDMKIDGKLNDYIGDMLDLSGKQVERYKAITNLIPELKEKVDNKEIGMSSVTGIASLPTEQQNLALKEINKIEESGKTVTREDTKEIKKNVENVEKLIPEFKKKIQKSEIEVATASELAALTSTQQKEVLKKIKKEEQNTGSPVSSDKIKQLKENVELSNKAPEETGSRLNEKERLFKNIKEKGEALINPQTQEAKQKGILANSKAKGLCQLLESITECYIVIHDEERYIEDLEEFKNILAAELEKIEK